MSKELIEYALAEGKENNAFHLKNMDELAREANTTLSFLTLAASSSLAGAVKYYGDEMLGSLWIPLLLLSFYLFGLCFLLVVTCLNARDVHPPANEPKNLLMFDQSLESIKHSETDHLQRAIQENLKRNESTGKALTIVRFAFFVSPLFFSATFVVVKVLSL